MKPLEHAISICGSQTALAGALKVAPQVVNNWIRRGSVPADRCPDIERVTAGEVRCEALRPDVNWAYLRGTSSAETQSSGSALEDRRSGGDRRGNERAA